MIMMEPFELAQLAVKALDDKKARNIKVLKTDKQTVLADYFVICNGTSSTHIKALTETVDEILSQAGEPPLRREGHRSGTWVLLDFAAVIVHIFTEEAREFYDLERLWGDAPIVDLDPILNPQA